MTQKLTINIGYLYGDLMNTYGDQGNITCLAKRCQWRNIPVLVKNISVGDRLKPGECDLFFFGGGQDQAQVLVANDLESSNKGRIIKKEVDKGVPLLSICGGYQLLGEYYQPHQGAKLPGVGLFPVFTVASFDRMIGNIIISWELDVPNYLVGFENHSGKTYLREGLPAGRQGALPLGKVVKGFGNNGADQTEGCVYKNAIGCYMHGSLLPKNPKLADWLLNKALEIKYGHSIELKPLDDSLENQAHQTAIKKFS